MHRYLEALGVKGYRPMGIVTAGRYVLDFIGWWAEERGVGHPSQVSRTVLERYQRWLRHYRQKDGMPLSIAGQRCKLVSLRGFSKWLTRVGEIPANPAADLELQEASPPATCSDARPTPHNQPTVIGCLHACRYRRLGSSFIVDAA